MKPYFYLITASLLLGQASAQSLWNGAGADNNWTTGANWGGTAPVANANLQFGGSTQLRAVNNFAAGTNFNSLTFNSGADAFTLSGNRISLSGDVVNSSSVLQTIDLEMTMTFTRTLNGGSGGLLVSRAIGQTANYGLNTIGNVTLTAASTYTGATTVGLGTLFLTGSATLPDAGALNLNATGSTLDISGISAAGESVGSLAGVAGSAILLGGKTLTATGGTTYSGTMSGTGGGFTKVGTSLLTLNGASLSHTGTTAVNEGSIRLRNASIIGGAITVASGARLYVSGNEGGTIGGSVTVAAGGLLEVSGSPASLYLASGTNITNNGSMTMTAFGLVNTRMHLFGNATLGGTGIFTLSDSGYNLISGDAGTEVFTHGAGHTIQGSGRIGVDTLSIINHGTILSNSLSNLRIDPNSSGFTNSATGIVRAASGSTLTFENGSFTNSGLIDSAGTTEFKSASVTNTGGTIRATAGTLAVTSSTITGGSVELSGSAGLNLVSGTLTGGTLTHGGTGALDSGGNPGAVSNISSAVSLTASNSITAGRPLNFTGGIAKNGVTTTFSGTGAITVSGTGISGAAANSHLTTSASSLSLSAANTYGGSTTISGGTLTVTGAGTLPDGTAVSLTASGAALNLAGISAGSETIGSLAGVAGTSVLLGGKNLTTGDGSTTGFAGVLSGSGGSLTKLGGGALTLSGTNTYTGPTTLGAGSVSIATLGNGGAAGNLGQATNAASNLVFDGGTLSYTGASASTNRNFTITAGKTAVWELTANNLTLTGASTVTTGNLTKTGAGTLTLGAAQGHTGTTTVHAGTLAYGVNNALSTGAVVVDGASAVLNLGGFSDTVSGITLVNGGSLTTSGGALTSTTDFDLRSGSSSGGLAGAVALTKSSSGTVSISGTNAYTEATLITGGILEVTANNALGTTAVGTTVQNGAALRLANAAYTSAEALLLNGSGISGGGALINSGTSSYAGQITAATNATIHAGGGALTLTGGMVKNGTTLTLTGGGIITVSGTGISGASANSDLVVSGTTVNLNAANTYNGPTFIRDAGVLNANVTSALPTSPRSALILDDTGSGSSTLAVNASNAAASLSGAASSTITLATGSTLTTGSSSGTSTFAGTLSGAGALVKDGSSTQILTGASSYSGSTIVTGGTLVVKNSTGSATGTGNLSIAVGATLAGTGHLEPVSGKHVYLNGSLIVGDPALSTPVASSLTLSTSGSGSTVLGSGSSLYLDLFSSGGDLTASLAAADRIRLFGPLDPTLGGSLILGNPEALSFVYGDRWTLFQVIGPGSILNGLSINASALGLSSGLFAEFDPDQGTLSIVPEPSRAIMLLTGMLLLQLRRCRQLL